jgi:hypothetical protein
MVAIAAIALVLGACGPPAQDTILVQSSDPALQSRVAELLPVLAETAHMDLVRPIRAERRTREELERYLRFKLDQELPPEEARRLTRSYALLGLLEEETDLRAILLSVYNEQVAGFYDPDSTALFVMDDMPAPMLETVLVHELVHAVQDQTANLDSLTAKERGSDRRAAAQSAIEGHATLVMFVYMAEQMFGEAFDIASLPDLSQALGPAMEAMRTQYPALTSAPAILRESLFFPYLEGANFVAALWSPREERPPPFGDFLPQSTEQVLNPGKAFGEGRDVPTELRVTLAEGYRPLYHNSLGQMELEILLEEHLGAPGRALAQGWDGDRYVLAAGPDEQEVLVWASVWDAAADRDRFLSGFQRALPGFSFPTSLEELEIDGRPGALLRVGVPPAVSVMVGEGPSR